MNDFWKDKTMHDFPYSRDDFAKAYFFAIHKWLKLLEKSLAVQDVVNIQECVEKIDELTERGFRYFDDPIDPNKDYREGTD